MISQIQKPLIRQATSEDAGFIEQMAYESGFPDWMENRPTIDEAKQERWFPPYYQDWGNQDGDYGLIAEDEQGKPIGAAWYRDYSALTTGEEVPKNELSVALLPEARGQKIGEKLMNRLLESAAAHGISEIGLIVRSNNERARKLYQKLGFLAYNESSDGYIAMKAPTSTALSGNATAETEDDESSSHA